MVGYPAAIIVSLFASCQFSLMTKDESLLRLVTSIQVSGAAAGAGIGIIVGLFVAIRRPSRAG
jgi:hypothetical protein